MDLVTCDPERPSLGALREAAETVLRGGILAFRSDTGYCLSCSLMDPSAVEFVHRLKQRPVEWSTVSLVEDEEAILPLVDSVSDLAEALMRRFWPGPLSLLFRASPLVPPRVRGPRQVITLRQPNHGLSMALLRAVGGPLVATSANFSGKPRARSAGEVLRNFGNQIDLVLDSGPTPDLAPATLVDVSGGGAEVLRAGAVDVRAFLAALGVRPGSP